MSDPAQAQLPESVIDAAIAWAVKLDYGHPTPEARAVFAQWLAADPLHALAWQRVHAMQGMRDELGALPPRLARDTLQAAQRQRRGAVRLLAWAGAAVAAGWAVREHTPWQRLLADASTATGEQKTLRLDDGSVVVLNTDSAISIDFAGPRRVIVLRRGEMLVTTGPDAGHPGDKRPFWVHTPFGALQALGTRFTVRLQNGQARVGVQQGAVELHPAHGGASHVVQAGENRGLRADGTQPAEPQGFAPDGWADGVIAGKNMRLGDLLAELARYRNGRIDCDERVAGLRVSGLFHVRDTDQVLQFLVQTQPVSVTYRTRFWVVVGGE